MRRPERHVAAVTRHYRQSGCRLLPDDSANILGNRKQPHKLRGSLVSFGPIMPRTHH